MEEIQHLLVTEISLLIHLPKITFKIVSSLALPNRFRDCGESANDEVAFDEDDDGNVCELLPLNLCGNVFDFSQLLPRASLSVPLLSIVGCN